MFLWQGVAEEYNRLKELKRVSPLAWLPPTQVPSAPATLPGLGMMGGPAL